MPPWLIIWISRFARGERFRKATESERRFGSAFFFLIPVFGGITFAVFNHNQNTSAFAIWVSLTVFGSAMLFGSFILARFVPAKICWTIGAVLWLTVVILALMGFV